ncbi:MAG TPA: hypothetical protein VMM80_02585, partial [Bacteroidota bacterium]|nr:hypothetical protein [Bacteroidota bacterium]
MRTIAAVLIVFFAAACARAQKGETVTVSAAPPHGGMRAGSTAFASVLITVAKGWHINSSAPADSELVATTLAPTPPGGLSVTGLRYPPAVRRVLAFSSEPLDLYEGAVPVTMELSAAAGLAPGEYSIPVEVSYQACN